MENVAVASVPDPNIHAVMRHFGFDEEAVLMSCRKFEDKRLLFYGELNRVWDEKKDRPYSAHELVMDLLQCDSNAAWRYMYGQGLV